MFVYRYTPNVQSQKYEKENLVFMHYMRGGFLCTQDRKASKCQIAEWFKITLKYARLITSTEISWK